MLQMSNSPEAQHNQHGLGPKQQHRNSPNHQFELQKEVPYGNTIEITI